MNGLSAGEVVERTSTPIHLYGRGWMLADTTLARAGELGLRADTPLVFWVSGRAGVLGDGDADKAAAAIAFMAPERVREFWESRPSQVTAEEATLAYADAAAAWGRDALASVSESDCAELAELCNRVAAAADPSIGSLFAGWRALAQPDDPAGAATIALNVVRELRGGAHIHAVWATGLGPLGAIISTDDPVRGGVTGAERFGWSAPFPNADPVARAEAESMTSAMIESVFDQSLDPSERSRFADLVDLAHTAAVAAAAG